MLVVMQLHGDDATFSTLDVLKLDDVTGDLHVRHRHVGLGFYHNLRPIHDLKQVQFDIIPHIGS